MPSGNIRKFGVNIELQLTKKGEDMVRKGKVVAPRKVTPEQVKLRAESVAKCRAESKRLKVERRKQFEADIESGKRQPLPPMTRKEKLRTDELEKRAKAWDKADAERAEAAEEEEDTAPPEDFTAEDLEPAGETLDDAVAALVSDSPDADDA